MNNKQLTFNQALKFLLSHMWRSFILCFPVALVVMPIMFLVMPKVTPGQPPPPPSLADGGKFFLIWLFMMAGMISAQCFSLMWTFKTKWSDFKVKVVDPNEL